VTFTLKLPTPIEIEVNSLGKMLFDNWNLSAMKAAREIKALKDGDIRTFMEEFVFLLGRKHDLTIANKREAYKSGEQINNISDLTDEELEKIAKTYIDLEIANLIPYISNDEENKEFLIERNKILREQFESETSKEHLRRLVNASLEANRAQSKKLMEQYSNIAKKWRDPLLKNSVALNNLGSQINDIVSIEIPRIPVIQNPIHETNAHLNNVCAQLEKLTSLTEAEIEQARLLNESSSLLLRASAESSEHAKKSIYVATGAILISTALSVWAIIETRSGNESSGVSLEKLISETRSNASPISSNIYELKQLTEKLQKEQQDQNVNVNELEAGQLDYLSKLVKILTQMENKIDSGKQATRKVNAVRRIRASNPP
jgi:hypothetical protein